MTSSPSLLRVGALCAALALFALPGFVLVQVAQEPAPLRFDAQREGLGGFSCHGAEAGAWTCAHVLTPASLLLLGLLVAGGACALVGALRTRPALLLAAAGAAFAAWATFAVSGMSTMAGPSESWWQMLAYPATVRGLLEPGFLVALLALALVVASSGLRERAKV